MFRDAFTASLSIKRCLLNNSIYMGLIIPFYVAGKMLVICSGLTTKEIALRTKRYEGSGVKKSRFSTQPLLGDVLIHCVSNS